MHNHSLLPILLPLLLVAAATRGNEPPAAAPVPAPAAPSIPLSVPDPNTEHFTLTPTPDVPASVPLPFPNEAPVQLHASNAADWVTFDALRLQLFLPQAAPTNIQLILQVADWDGAWFQLFRPDFLRPGETNIVTFGLTAETRGWTALGHPGAWHRRSHLYPNTVQLKLFATGATAPAEPLLLLAAEGLPSTDSAPPFIRNIRPTEVSQSETPVDGRFELRFDLPDRYANPFDPDEIAVDAEILTPSGTLLSVPCFYYQDCLRQPTATEERILPQGRPEWRLRFSPNEEGPHSISLVARDRFGSTRADAVATLTATPATGLRTVHVSSRDPRFFEDTGGNLFFPLGYNIRSPFDARMDANFPTRFRHPEGTTSYGRRFQQMAASGINIAEIWASAWCMGLEWSPTKPGYHGIGQYNLLHAWERDRVFEMAAENGLRLNLILNNHGRLSDFSDPEWDLNPFNANTQPGGWYSDPIQWFIDERARVQYEKQLRYEIARYSWNANLFAWQLWSELNISCRQAHLNPQVHAWHSRMANYLHAHDPKRHPIATHTSGDYNSMVPALAAIQELDHICGDAYHNSRDTLHIHTLMRNTKAQPHLRNRAALITEFGGTSGGASIEHLRREVHSALWNALPSGLAGAPMFWWWHIVEEYDFFPMYKAFSHYLAGENFLDDALQPLEIAPYTTPPNPPEGQPRQPDVCTDIARSPTRGYAWIHVLSELYNTDPDPTAPPLQGYQLTLPFEEHDGDICTFEFWDTTTGTIHRTQDIRIRHGKATVEVPPFHRDIALKFRLTPAP